ncbi:hypothetical protein AB9T88_15890 [Flavobacterium sp. LBUM151]
MYFPLQDIEAAKLNIDDPNHLKIHSLETFGTHDGPGAGGTAIRFKKL